MRIEVIVWGVCFLCASAFAQLSDISTSTSEVSAKEDNRVRQALENAGLKYSINKSGDFRLVIGVKDGRTQLVAVNSRTSTYDRIETRRVWAVAFSTGEEVSKSNLQTLLERNDDYKLGAWSLDRENGKWFAKFRVSVPADCQGSELRSFIKCVAETTDEIEKAATGGADKY